MKYRDLGRTGIKVSPYALGALMFATVVGNPDPEDCLRQSSLLPENRPGGKSPRPGRTL
jgi:hypothetical protein